MIDVGKAFGIRRHEVGPASLLFFYLFLIIGAYIMGQAVGNALFLEVFPRHLPYAMIGSAVMIGGFVSTYIRLSHRLRLEMLVIGTLLFFASSFCLFWWLTRFHYRSVYLLVYAWVYALGAMGPMMGWTLANYTLTTREARRIFSLIQLGPILGGVFIGFFTADVMRHGHLRPNTLLLVVALILVGCAMLVKLLFQRAGPRLAEVRLAPAAHDAPRNFQQSVRVIRKSPYLLSITALIAIGCLATSILGYQFFLIAKDSYGHNTAGLTAFIARFYGYMGLITLVFQLALTGPLLRAFGIRVGLFALPVSLLASSLGVFFATGLVTGSILRGSHYILRYSLDKSATELLYLPVAPEVKSQVKSFIDTFVWRSADGIAGLVLLLFASVLKFSPGKVSLVNMVILFGWIGVAYAVRREYLNVLRQAIERRTLDPERTAAGVLDSTTTEVLAESLKRGQEQQLLYGLSLFEIGREPGRHPVLRGLLEHASPAVRQRALRLLGDAGDQKILPQVEKMLKDESPEVRTEALHYLALHAGRDPLSLLEADSDFTDYSLAGSVAAYLARTRQPDNLATAQAILQGMLSRTGPDAPRSRVEAARALGAIPAASELHSDLLTLLRDEEIEVQEQALLSAGKIGGRQFLPLVIEKLAEQRLRGAARAALAEYGERAVGTLRDYLNDEAVSLPVRKQIPNVLARIATPEAAAALAESLVQPDAGLRFDLLKALNKLRRRDPGLMPADADFADLLNLELMGYYRSVQILEAFEPHASNWLDGHPSSSVLTRALGERMEYEFERIFRLLALLYPPRDIYNAYVGVKSGRAQLRANALEVLEHLLKPEHYRMLSYVLDPEITASDRLSFARRFCRVGVNSKAEALRILLRCEDRWLCACSLHAIGELGLAELCEDVRQLAHAGDSLLEETWRWTSARLGVAGSA